MEEIEIDQKEEEKVPRRGRPRGYRVSDETREKIRASMTGKHHSDETKRRMSETMTGRHHAPETVERIRVAALSLGRVRRRERPATKEDAELTPTQLAIRNAARKLMGNLGEQND